MQQPNRSITFEGELSAGGVRGNATLTVKSSQIVLWFHPNKYVFESQQVTAIELGSTNSIYIEHTLVNYPERICFSPSATAQEFIRQTREIGFIPSALVEEIPIRDGIPIRLSAIIPIAMLVYCFFLVDKQLGWVKLDPHQLGSYSPLAMSGSFVLFLSVRFIPIMQKLILRSGRHIGEIIPSIELGILLSGISALASILVLIRIPELLSIGMCIGILLVRSMLIRDREADAP